MQLSFHGAAETVTGSKHLLTLNSGTTILLDCGLFQGFGKDSLTYNETFGFDPKTVDYLLLSHAHVDHSGLIPLLVKRGFRGRIFGSAATLDMTTILLKNSAYIQEADVKFINKKRLQQGRSFIEPLYTMDDALNSIEFFEPLPVEQPVQIDGQIQARCMK
jgi:metallo-beta-lactamase family protein